MIPVWGEVGSPDNDHTTAVRGEQTYRFVVRGRRLDRFESALQASAVRTDSDETVVTATILDQSHLRAVLHNIRDLELQLVTLERLEPVAEPSAVGAN